MLSLIMSMKVDPSIHIKRLPLKINHFVTNYWTVSIIYLTRNLMKTSLVFVHDYRHDYAKIKLNIKPWATLVQDKLVLRVKSGLAVYLAVLTKKNMLSTNGLFLGGVMIRYEVLELKLSMIKRCKFDVVFSSVNCLVVFCNFFVQFCFKSHLLSIQ